MPRNLHHRDSDKPTLRRSPVFWLGRLLLCCSLVLATSAYAERADRDQPVQLEADRVTVDDIKRTHVFEGNVVLTQGTLEIRTETLIVKQDEKGFQNGVAKGGKDGLAHFRQKREGSDIYIEGQAEEIKYDAHADKAEFFNRARVNSGGDEVNGHFISYDAVTEKYLVTSAPGAKPGKGRVTAIIQPKGNQPKTANK